MTQLGNDICPCVIRGKGLLLLPGSNIRKILEDQKRAPEAQTLGLGAKRGFEIG